MPYRQCGVVRVAVWSLWLTVGVLARAAGFNHWMVTEDGKIEFQVCMCWGNNQVVCICENVHLCTKQALKASVGHTHIHVHTHTCTHIHL